MKQTSTAKSDKEKRFVLYRSLHRTFRFILLFSLVLGIGGMASGLGGWRNGFLLFFIGFVLGIIIMPFYLIYRGRFLKAQLAVQMLQCYTNKK